MRERVTDLDLLVFVFVFVILYVFLVIQSYVVGACGGVIDPSDQDLIGKVRRW